MIPRGLWIEISRGWEEWNECRGKNHIKVWILNTEKKTWNLSLRVKIFPKYKFSNYRIFIFSGDS